jgi:hypothetical protein
VRRVAEIRRILRPQLDSRGFHVELDKKINNLAANREIRYGN